jgi:hypothetical protein
MKLRELHEIRESANQMLQTRRWGRPSGSQSGLGGATGGDLKEERRVPYVRD